MHGGIRKSSVSGLVYCGERQGLTPEFPCWFKRFGRPSLLLAWLPIVGDPLCLVAGVLRVGVPVFLLLVTLGKLARYAALAWVM